VLALTTICVCVQLTSRGVPNFLLDHDLYREGGCVVLGRCGKFLGSDIPHQVGSHLHVHVV